MEEWVLPEGLDDRQDLLWLRFVAREFSSQSGYARGENSIQTGGRLGQWKLLAPNEIGENISHEWAEYESVATRLAQKIGDINKGVQEFGAVTNAAKSLLGGRQEGGSKTYSAEKAMSVLNRAAGAASGSSIPQYKVDSSLTYQNTQRREYSFTFTFTQYTETNEELYSKLFQPIRELERLSCPELPENGSLISIQFPAIFRVYTWPSDLIKINHAALTSVQPTWKGPFKNGNPTSCDLQLTFTDIEPLYRRSFKRGGIIKTSNGE